MNAEQFTATSIALLRSAVGWQTQIARRLDVQPRQVRRWLAAGEAPAWVDDKLRELIGLADIAPWPRDEWMIGDALGRDGRRREYLYHMQPPRFTARVVACDDDGRPLPDEQPADVVSGVVYASGDIVLCELDWIDEVGPGEIVKWMEAAADAVDAADQAAAN